MSQQENKTKTHRLAFLIGGQPATEHIKAHFEIASDHRRVYQPLQRTNALLAHVANRRANIVLRTVEGSLLQMSTCCAQLYIYSSHRAHGVQRTAKCFGENFWKVDGELLTLERNCRLKLR